MSVRELSSKISSEKIGREFVAESLERLDFVVYTCSGTERWMAALRYGRNTDTAYREVMDYLRSLENSGASRMDYVSDRSSRDSRKCWAMALRLSLGGLIEGRFLEVLPFVEQMIQEVAANYAVTTSEDPNEYDIAWCEEERKQVKLLERLFGSAN